MVNYDTYLYIFDEKFSLKGTYNVNYILNIEFENWCNSTLIFISFAINKHYTQ